MTRGQVPILDLRIKSGSTVQDISLWRDEALSELYVGDMVELTHLKATITSDGKGCTYAAQHSSNTNIQNRVAHIDWITFNGQ